ncbi:hypothetical protein J2Y69_002310 [Microbacterium resistens]|uniref:Uncharacterized protein n=1 Tax=Microbacterium resistens TaxID=156977 RepID=A0ABU1SDL6_9MICO|nr:hypothetical protein [Microbacterium resistens]MDR6867706.1 hypothetical protein [Microbacterium resistens]
MAGRNFGRQAQSRARREAKDHLALSQTEIDAETLYHPPEECDCVVLPQEIYLDATNQMLVVLYLHQQRLVRFFMAWQCRTRDGDWAERYSVCTLHGYLHEHTTGHSQPNDRRDVTPLYSQADVQECHDRAYDLVHTRYQFANGGTYG